ncbi:MAG TPA: hypothetical protein VMW69_06565, partial [Spirochaetia bacterium]|nr:hypothetical protein [Spirochaetia bacterium]
MKQSPQLQKAQDNMAPGVITLDGFLGSDKRNLGDILSEDEAIVRRLGMTHEHIAHVMQAMRDAGMRGLGELIAVAPHFEVRVDSVRGKLPCPFQHPGIFPKTNITVKNKKKGSEITFTDLHIHLVNEHGFYEGRGSTFRLDPQ